MATNIKPKEHATMMAMQLGLFGENNFDEQKRLNRLTVLGDRLPPPVS